MRGMAPKPSLTSTHLPAVFLPLRIFGQDVDDKGKKIKGVVRVFVLPANAVRSVLVLCTHPHSVIPSLPFPLSRILREDVDDKRKEVETVVRSFVYSADVVRSMLAEKRAAASGRRRRKLVVEIERLKREIAAAEQRGDAAEVRTMTKEVGPGEGVEEH